MNDTQFCEMVERQAKEIFSSHSPRQKMDEHQRLTIEALEYIRAGDIDEAHHRIKLRNEPKWRSITACERDYAAAMAETRAARGAA